MYKNFQKIFEAGNGLVKLYYKTIDNVHSCFELIVSKKENPKPNEMSVFLATSPNIELQIIGNILYINSSPIPLYELIDKGLIEEDTPMKVFENISINI